MEARIERLRRLVRAHGQMTLQRHFLLTSTGRSLVAALNTYLAPDEGLVEAVPPQGEWDPSIIYGDAAFSTFGLGRLSMDPVQMGIAVRIDGLDDLESLWIRLAVQFDCEGDHVAIDVPGADKVRILAREIDEAHLFPACQAVETALLQLFDDSCADRRGHYDGGRIGFVVVKAGATVKT
jgi:hypothetical protein